MLKFILRTFLFLMAFSSFSQTCQIIDLQLDNYSPAKTTEGYIRVCVNQTITLEGSAVFSNNNTGATYEWDLGDGNTVAGTTASFSYDTPGVYIVNLNVSGTIPTRCATSNNINLIVQVSTEPNFAKTEAYDSVLCFGESTTIEGNANPERYNYNCTPPEGTTTTLPDGVGVPYETSIFVDCYNQGQVLSDISQLESICLTIEHSFIGDLDIDIISPNGQTVRILNSEGGVTANLGHPWADGVRNDRTGNLTPGVGDEYCIIPDNSLKTLMDGIKSGGVFTVKNGPGTYIDDYVPAGNYKSESPLSGLVGSPLNGQWKVRIVDNAGGDNGYIFKWGINFNSSILPIDYSFTPNIVSEVWDTDPSILSVSGNDIVVQPSTAGTHCYSYKVVDDFGCEYIKEVCIDVIREVLIETPPENIYICDVGNDNIEIFDFTNNFNLVIGSQPISEVEVSFHLTEDAAINDKEALSITYENALATETIWVRIADITQTCFKITRFNINVIPMPIANIPTPYEICDNTTVGNDTDGLVSGFDLSTKINEVLGSQLALYYDVRFYYSQADADARNNLNEITTVISNTTNPQSIFARIEHKQSTDCYDTTSFNLIVNPLPTVTPIVDLTQCDDDVDGLSLFNLTEANTLISTNYINETFTYYLTDAQAQTGLMADQITNITAYPNPAVLNSVVYARIETTNGCYSVSRINLLVGITQIPTNFHLDYFECDNYIIDNDNTNGVASFNFSDAEQTIKNLFPVAIHSQITISYYTNLSDALSELNDIPDISNHRNDASPFTQNIYVRIDTDIVNACLGLGHHITLTANPLPVANVVSDYILCGDSDFASFNLSTKTVEVVGSQTQAVLVSYHESLTEAENNTNPITTTYSNTISNPQTIYVRSQFDDNNNGVADIDECFSTDIAFNLVVNHNPILIQPDPIIICSEQINTTFDLTVRENQITNGDASIILSYYESQLDLDNRNPITVPANYLNTQLDRNVFVLATGDNTCTSQITMSLKTILYENLNEMPMAIEECETDNDGYDIFDLRRRENEILNGMLPSDFVFSYYENETDAIAGNANNIESPSSFINTTPVKQTIYARVLPIANACFIVVPIPLIVNPVPEIAIEESYVICLSQTNISTAPNLTTFLPNPPINTMLNTSEYTFQWYKGLDGSPANILVEETASTYIPTEPGNFTVIATNINTGCTIPATTKVIGSYPPESIAVELVSEAFSENNILEVSVVGSGEYEYKIDSGSWQMASSFERVNGGDHIIYVRDLYNCNMISEMKVVIDYPKYFTPNGDGYNDTWNVKGISLQPNAKIFIYNRYGKLLKQLSPKSLGWNGTINGELMPTNDYWFTVEYTEPMDGVLKQFKAHFSLKR